MTKPSNLLRESVTYFNTEDFNWSVYKYTLTTSCVGYKSLHKVATLPWHTGINWNHTWTTIRIRWNFTRRNFTEILSTRKLKIIWNWLSNMPPKFEEHEKLRQQLDVTTKVLNNVKEEISPTLTESNVRKINRLKLQLEEKLDASSLFYPLLY